MPDRSRGRRAHPPGRTGSAGCAGVAEELAADKILALFGRAAARDYQDVAALRRHFSWTVLFELAREKDAGFNPKRFLEAVAAFDRLDADEFDTSRAGHERLRAEVAAWPSDIRSQR